MTPSVKQEWEWINEMNEKHYVITQSIPILTKHTNFTMILHLVS